LKDVDTHCVTSVKLEEKLVALVTKEKKSRCHHQIKRFTSPSLPQQVMRRYWRHNLPVKPQTLPPLRTQHSINTGLIRRAKQSANTHSALALLLVKWVSPDFRFTH
jgi:hypothetical protein